MTLFSVEFTSSTQCVLSLGARCSELAWAQVMNDEFNVESLPHGLTLRLLQEERGEDDRYIHPKLLQGGLSPIYYPQEPALDWCGHISCEHGDIDVYVFSLSRSSSAASLWSAATSRREGRWGCRACGRPALPCLVKAATLVTL